MFVNSSKLKDFQNLFVQVNLFQKHSLLNQLTWYDNRLFVEYWLQYKKNTSSEHVVYKNCILFCFGIQNNFCTQHVLNLYFSCTEVSNQCLLLYCGLTDSRLSASDANLPVWHEILVAISDFFWPQCVPSSESLHIHAPVKSERRTILFEVCQM